MEEAGEKVGTEAGGMGAAGGFGSTGEVGGWIEGVGTGGLKELAGKD